MKRADLARAAILCLLIAGAWIWVVLGCEPAPRPDDLLGLADQAIERSGSAVTCFEVQCTDGGAGCYTCEPLLPRHAR